MRVLERGVPLALATGPARPLRVVAAGGGTGLPAVLSGLAAAGARGVPLRAQGAVAAIHAP